MAYICRYGILLACGVRRTSANFTASALKAFRIAHTTRCTQGDLGQFAACFPYSCRPTCSCVLVGQIHSYTPTHGCVGARTRPCASVCVSVRVCVASNTQSFDFVPSQPLWQLSLLANISGRVFKRRIRRSTLLPYGNLSVFKFPLYPVEKWCPWQWLLIKI